MQILEAFRALNALNEDVFDIDADGIQKLSDFKQNDDLEDDISIIDADAETEEDLQDNYIGKVILDCCTCHSKLYKAKEDVTVDESGELANVGEECPYCYTPDGFKIIGEVVAFNNTEDAEDADSENSGDVESETVESDEDEEKDAVKENLEEGIFGIKTKKEKAAEAKAKAEREAKRKAEREEAEERERERGAQIARDWKARENRDRQAKRDYERSRYNSIKGDSPSNTGYRGVSYSGGDYYESLDDNENKEKLEEDIQDLSMTANDTHIEVSEEGNGKVTVSMEPVTADGGETIEPVSPETEADIMGTDEFTLEGEEMPEEGIEGDEMEIPIDEMDEDSMDESLNSYFKRVYENVKSYKTTSVKSRGDTMIVEGKIKFNTGSVKKTSFIFEAKDATKGGRVRFVGDNKQLTEGNKAFTLTGRVTNKRLIVESMSYNYKHSDGKGNTSHVRGSSRVSNKRV